MTVTPWWDRPVWATDVAAWRDAVRQVAALAGEPDPFAPSLATMPQPGATDSRGRTCDRELMIATDPAIVLMLSRALDERSDGARAHVSSPLLDVLCEALGQPTPKAGATGFVGTWLGRNLYVHDVAAGG